MARVYRFTVEGRMRFPVDMLRYDACYPANNESVTAITDSLDSLRRRENITATYKVDLVSQVHGCEPARWASFGWTVTEQRRI